MSDALGLQTEFNSFVDKYGGSILHYPVTSGTTNEWGEISTSAKFTTSGFVIGMLQAIKDNLLRREFGDAVNNMSICYTKSGTTSFNIGDKVSYKSKDYEITNISPNVASDLIIFYSLMLNNL